MAGAGRVDVFERATEEAFGLIEAIRVVVDDAQLAIREILDEMEAIGAGAPCVGGPAG